MDNPSIQGYRLSFAQQRAWRLNRVAQEGGQPFVSQAVFKFPHGSSQDSLRPFLEALIARHESLRTRFEIVPGLEFPLQKPCDEGGIEWTTKNAEKGWDTRSDGLQGLMAIEAARPLDWVTGPKVRAHWIEGSASSGYLILTVPGLLADVETLSLFGEELAAQMAAVSFTEPPTQYIDFSEWQHGYLASADSESGRGYWKSVLAEVAKLSVVLPFERRGMAPRLFHRRCLRFSIPVLQSRALEEVARKLGQEPRDLLLGAFIGVLYRLSGAGLLALSLSTEGRSFPEMLKSFGPFARSLPISLRLDSSTSFSSLVVSAKEKRLEATQSQDAFQEPDSFIEWERQSIAFSFERGASAYQDKLPGQGSVQWVLGNSHPTSAKLHLVCSPAGDSWEYRFHFDPARFSAEGIGRVAEEFVTFLTSALAQPDALIEAIGIVGPVERAELIPPTSPPKKLVVDASDVGGRCVPQQFEEQARLYPQRPAVVCGDRSLTYAQLNEKANAVAEILMGAGVGPEVLVGLCCPRSLEMMVGMLAILKAGGAYVALEPGYPEERIQFLVRDTSMPVILTLSALQSRLASFGPKVVCLDALALPATTNGANPEPRARLEHAAYVIYTSGSTGQPKGVVVEHRQLIAYLKGVQDRIGFVSDAHFATVSTIAADLGNTMIFPALCGGGCLHVIDESTLFDPAAMVRYFETHPIDYLKIVPSHLRALLKGGDGQKILPRRALVLGGEASHADWVAELQRMAPACQIFNHYGPTETTVGVMAYPVSEAASIGESGCIPLGRPLNGVTAYVLDASGQLLPMGVPGELYIGGHSVARGYWNRSELTSTRFLPDPFSTVPGSRMYRTGDLVRRLEEGRYEFLGRVDHQVKVRGFRVELGEIESQLTQHPQLREAVVTVLEDSTGDKRLVAYVVGRGAAVPPTAELRAWLSKRLPEYMVPAVFVSMEALPLNANGKVDRRQLPLPSTATPKSTRAPDEPLTDLQQQLRGIWREVLKLESIGLNDNFFELGGDSILAIQIVARAQRAGISVTPLQMLHHPTLESLASVAQWGKRVTSEQGKVTGELVPGPVFHWFLEQGCSRLDHYNQALFLEVHPDIHAEWLPILLRALEEHHDALRLRRSAEGRFYLSEKGSDGAYRRVSVPSEGWPPPEKADAAFMQDFGLETGGQKQSPGEELLAGVTREAQSSLSLEHGPIYRCVYFDPGPGKPGLLFWCIHHFAVDGISWRVLMEDLELGYRQLSEGKPIQFPPKTTSIVDWLKSLDAFARSETLVKESTYWSDRSRDGIPSLPVDFEQGRAENWVRAARSIQSTLTQEETRRLSQELPKIHRTQGHELLLTALSRALARWTGQTRHLLELEGHGREDIGAPVDVTRTVGWFTALYPMVLQADVRLPIGECVQQIKNQLRGIPNRGVGYGLLRYCSHRPELQQVLQQFSQPELRFNYLGDFDRSHSASSTFRLTRRSTGPIRSGDDRRRYSIDVFASITGGRLRVDWIYGSAMYRPETIQRVADGFVEELRHLLSGQDSVKAGVSVQDFPMAKLKVGQLNQLLSKLNKSKSEVSG